jgi:hypothetical protein
MASDTRNQTTRKKPKGKKASDNGSAKKQKQNAGLTWTQVIEDWDNWTKKLVSRTTIDPLTKFSTIEQPVHLWGFHSQLDSSTVSFISECERIGNGKKPKDKDAIQSGIDRWLQKPISQWDLDTAVGLLSACKSFPQLTQVIEPKSAQQLLQTLIATTQPDCRIDLERQPLVAQLIHGELALRLASMFGGLLPNEITDDAHQAIRFAISELLDSNGLPQAKLVDDFHALVACWIRCAILAKAMRSKLLDATTKQTFHNALQQLFRMTRKNGTPIFSDKHEGQFQSQLYAAATHVANSTKLKNISKLVLPRVSGRQREAISHKSLPESTDYSEWSEVALLQSKWLRDCPKVAVVFDQRRTRLEISCGPTIVSGLWDLHLSLNGELLAPEADIAVVCWHSDDDCDLLELEVRYAHDIVVQRQILLSREDAFVFLADAVISKGPQAQETIEYHSTLPISVNKMFIAETETTEGFIVGKKRLAAVLPLSLPEWRSACRHGSQQLLSGNRLQLSQRFTGCGYFPTFIDMNLNRIKKPLTWRQLTVAERLEIVPGSVAAAFRAQVNDSQWLFYRSLTEPRNRSFFGVNVACEFYSADFEDGETTEILSIADTEDED